MLIKTLMFVRVIVLLYPNIEQGGRGIFSKRENSLFPGLKWTTVKLYSLPNYFCLWLSENSGCGRERSKLDDFLSVETSSKNTRRKYSVEKNICRILLRQFLAHTPVYIRHVLQSGKYNYCSFRGTGRESKYKCKIISVKAIDYSIGWYAPNVKARYSAFTTFRKNHSDCDSVADIFLSTTPFFTTFSTCQFARRANYEAEWTFAEL